MRQKDFGIWQSFTWDEEYEQVRDLCLGMIAMGLQSGDRVAIIGDNDREYLWGVYAVMAAGGTPTGLFTDVTPPEVEYIVGHSDATFALAGDQEQCDKLLEIKDNLPLVKKVIYWDDRGMWYYDDDWLVDFKDVQRLGRESDALADERFEQLIAAGRGDQPAFFCYTSGTTGLPKGAIISHTNFVFITQAFSKVLSRRPTDSVMSFIPLAWIGGAVLDIAPHAVDGVVLNFAESPETVRDNIRELAPDYVFYNARLWETLVDTIRARILDATWLNRKLYDLFLPVGYKAAEYRFEKRAVPWHWRFLEFLGRLLVFRPLLSQFGLHRIRWALTAGSSLSPDVVRFFHALGLRLHHAYGTTEITAASVAQPPGELKFESVGKALPGTLMKISDEGEVLLGGPTLFLGYHKNEEATAESIYEDEEGVKWFRTGDAGRIDEDGHLIFFERLKDMIELAGGEKYSPQYIEGRLKFSPYIGQAMTVGDSARGFVTSMITIDFENVGRWAEKRGIPYTTYTDLSQKPEVYELIRKDVEEVNRTLPESGRVRKFVLLHKEFDADEGEMTRSRKLRRRFLSDRYDHIIESMYNGAEEVTVQAVVKYRDGRESTSETTLRIEALQEAVSG